MDTFLLSKSTVVISEDIQTTTNGDCSITTSRQQTSTPTVNYDNNSKKQKFTFISPENLNTNNTSNNNNTTTSSNSVTTTKTTTTQHIASNKELNNRQTNVKYDAKKVILKSDNSQLEAELKLKENYVNHLKSIDLAKYSFPNEFRPKTDYTYAKTGIYLTTTKRDECVEEPFEVPNLCRRSRRPSPQNSTNSSLIHNTSTNNSNIESRLNASNIISTIKNYFITQRTENQIYNTNAALQASESLQQQQQQSLSNQQTSTSYLSSSLINSNTNNGAGRNVNSSNRKTSSQQHNEQTTNNERKFYMNNLYGLDDNSSSTADLIGTTRSSSNRRERRTNDRGINTVPLSSESSRCSSCLKCCLLLPLLLLLLPFLLSSSREYLYNYFQFINLTKNETNISINNNKYIQDFDMLFIRNEIMNNINSVKEQLFQETLEKFRNSKIADFDGMKSEFNERFNSTLAIFLAKLADQDSTFKESKESCNQQLETMKEIIKQLESKYALLQIATANAKLEPGANFNTDGSISIPDAIEYKIEDIIKRILYVYNADKTGMTDFASESLGASIMFTRCTETYTEKSRWLTVLNYPILKLHTTPRVVIQNAIHPGNCWAFKGNKADLFIKLAAIITPKSFSMEHIPRELTPTGTLDTAPQNFSVYGYNDEGQIDTNQGTLLGSYRYDNTSKEIIQFFNVQNEPKEPISIVELKIESNAGNRDYTCLYKFRVHGNMIKNDGKSKQNEK